MNMASRMESTCPQGLIQMSKSCYDAVRRGKKKDKFLFKDRGGVKVKGKGDNIQTYYLEGEVQPAARTHRSALMGRRGSDFTRVSCPLPPPSRLVLAVVHWISRAPVAGHGVQTARAVESPPTLSFHSTTPRIHSLMNLSPLLVPPSLHLLPPFPSPHHVPSESGERHGRSPRR